MQSTAQAAESKSDAQNTDNHVIFSAMAEKLAAFMNDTVSIRLVIWCVGMLACMTYFTQSYLRCRFEFQTSVPVENLAAQRWLTKHCCRTISIRQSGQDFYAADLRHLASRDIDAQRYGLGKHAAATVYLGT